MRNSYKNTCSVTGISLATTSTTMGHSYEHLQSVRDGFSGGLLREVSDKTHTTGIFVILRIKLWEDNGKRRGVVSDQFWELRDIERAGSRSEIEMVGVEKKKLTKPLASGMSECLLKTCTILGIWLILRYLAEDIGYLSFLIVILFSGKEPWRRKPKPNSAHMRSMYRDCITHLQGTAPEAR